MLIKKVLNTKYSRLLLAASLLLFGCHFFGEHKEKTVKQTDSVYFNQKFIEGLYSTSLDLENPKEVFGFIFSQLDDRVMIYPTENYYYFSFTAQGKTINGNLALDARERDHGKIRIVYFLYSEGGNFPYDQAVVKDFAASDGVLVQKKTPLLYSVTYNGRTVTFELNNIGFFPPKGSKLHDDEEFVGPIFDESGLKFFLIYHTATRHLFYVLNEDGFVPEAFVPISDKIVIGKRTDFAFYMDQENHRKILIGVYVYNVRRNNYYDGPFDQMPDNYVSQTHMRKYLESAYPSAKGRLDDFGGFLKEGVRLGVSPYKIWFTLKDLLDLVESCQAANLDPPAFTSCITAERKAPSKKGG